MAISTTSFASRKTQLTVVLQQFCTDNQLDINVKLDIHETSDMLRMKYIHSFVFNLASTTDEQAADLPFETRVLLLYKFLVKVLPLVAIPQATFSVKIAPLLDEKSELTTDNLRASAALNYFAGGVNCRAVIFCERDALSDILVP